MRQRVQCGVHHDPPRGLLADQHSRLEVNEGHKKKRMTSTSIPCKCSRTIGRQEDCRKVGAPDTCVGLPRITLRVSAVLDSGWPFSSA